MNPFSQTEEQLNLIKCLECRLLAPPPVFDMPPPPPLSPEFIDMLNQQQQQVDTNNERRKSKLSPSQQRRCLKFKNILISRNIIPAQPIESIQKTKSEGYVSHAKSNSKLGIASATPLINLTTNQSMVLFLACFLVFLIVLTVALVLIVKHFSIRKKQK